MVAACILLAFFVVTYIFTPFPQPWNDILNNQMYFLAAASGAVFCSLTTLEFKPGEKPRRIWGYFALALWSWALAEQAWALYAAFGGKVPIISPADFFWVLGFIFFTASFGYHFRLIYNWSYGKAAYLAAGAFLSASALSLVLAWVQYSLIPHGPMNFLESWLEVWYIVADLAVAAAVVWLRKIFSRGQWGQVLPGLLLMVVTDTIYNILNATGLYSQSIQNGNALSLIADGTYVAAYLLLAVACLGQLLLVKYGPPETQTLETAVDSA